MKRGLLKSLVVIVLFDHSGSKTTFGVSKTDNLRETKLKGSWLRRTSHGTGVLNSRAQKHRLLKQVIADNENLHSSYFSDNATSLNKYCCEKIRHGDDGYPMIQAAERYVE